MSDAEVTMKSALETDSGRFNRSRACLVLLPALLLAGFLPLRAAADFTKAEVSASVRTLGRADFFPDIDPPRGVAAMDSVYLAGGGIIELGGGSNMNRVDGFTPLGLQGLLNNGWTPSIRGYEAYGTTSKDWSGAGEIYIHPFANTLILGGRWYDETAVWPLPVRPIRPIENFLAAFFLRLDFYDYLRRRGKAGFAEWGPSPGRGLQVAYFDEQQTSQPRTVAKFGPFGGDREFRENPQVEEGRWRILRARLMWAFGPVPKVWSDQSEHALLLDAQFSREVPGEDREFVRLWGEQRGRQKLTPSQFFGYRLAGGFTPEGTVRQGSRLPVQWRFRAGGVGSLRAHGFNEFEGDRIVLGTAEYGITIEQQVRPILFIDTGKAWNESSEAERNMSYALDGGIGLQLGSGPMTARLDAARDLRREHAPVHFIFRFGIPY
jgi:hypothetical protein